MVIHMTRQQLYTRGGILDELMDTGFSAAGLVDAAGRLIRYSVPTLRDLGKTQEECVGRPSEELDPDTHLGLTGKPNDKVFNCLNFLSAKGKRIWIRIVLLEGLSATPEYIKKISAFLKNYKIEKIELLPYHNMGEKKWEALGLKYELKDAKTPDRGKVAALAKILEDDGYVVSFQ